MKLDGFDRAYGAPWGEKPSGRRTVRILLPHVCLLQRVLYDVLGCFGFGNGRSGSVRRISALSNCMMCRPSRPVSRARATGLSEVNTARSSLIYSGDVPQQPPTIFTHELGKNAAI